MNAIVAPETIERCTDAVLDAHSHIEGPLRPILHAIQEELGYIPETALPQIARRLNIGRAEVHGVVSFYHDFRTAPAGKTTLKICRAEACQSMGGTALAEAAMSELGIGWHDTTPDGKLTLEPVYCLGLCACSPAVMVGNKVVGRVDTARLDKIIAEARK